MMVRGEPFRAKYRNSWSKPTPLTPGKIEKIEITMPDICYTFKKGHKIMVQVHSTWFPLIDRNPQKFCDIFQANESDFQRATHRLHVGGQYPSSISAEVLDSTESPMLSEALQELFGNVGASYVLPAHLDRRLKKNYSARNLTFEAVLQNVLREAGLTYRVTGGVYEFVELDAGQNPPPHRTFAGSGR